MEDPKISEIFCRFLKAKMMSVSGASAGKTVIMLIIVTFSEEGFWVCFHYFLWVFRMEMGSLD